MFGAFGSSRDNENMFKIVFWPMFDNFNVNLVKNEEFLTYIPCIPIPEYVESNAYLVSLHFLYDHTMVMKIHNFGITYPL